MAATSVPIRAIRATRATRIITRPSGVPTVETLAAVAALERTTTSAPTAVLEIAVETVRLFCKRLF
jgi:hypothetical protein